MTLEYGRIDQLCSYLDSAMQKTQMELILLTSEDVRIVVLDETDTHTPYIGTLSDSIFRMINSDILT